MEQKNGVTILEDTAEIDAIARLEGFGDAMIAVGWMAIVDGTVRVTHFERHLGKSAKNRANTAKRVASHRVNRKT